MTTQSDLKKLAEQMPSSMNSFDDIKDFQKQLMQSFIDTALEAVHATSHLLSQFLDVSLVSHCLFSC